MERTVVHILSASLNYQSFVLHLITCLIETDLSWDFIGQGQNNDLHAIRRTKSRLGKTRMYILTRASEYKVLSIRVGHSASSEDWSHIRICFGTESEPVGYSEGTHSLETWTYKFYPFLRSTKNCSPNSAPRFLKPTAFVRFLGQLKVMMGLTKT